MRGDDRIMNKLIKALSGVVLVIIIFMAVKEFCSSTKDIFVLGKTADRERMTIVATWNPEEKILDKESEDNDVESIADSEEDMEITANEDKEVVPVIMTPKPTLKMLKINKKLIKNAEMEKRTFEEIEDKSGKREQTEKLAKSFVGKIRYLWGGKPSDSDIAGKTVPSALDCSGFIQYIYSSVNGKRINELGSTIAISGIQKINKSELKVGDIGLKLGTGSLYYDADGKAYGEPGSAASSNLSKRKKADNMVETYTRKCRKIKASIKIANGRIDRLEEDIRKYERLVDEHNQPVAGDLETESEQQKEGAEISDKIEESTVKSTVRANGISGYKLDIKNAKKEVKSLKNKINNDKKRLKSVNDNVKKWKEIESQYDAEIERSIDHVGIYCGTNENGEQMWCHCSSSGGGVVFQATDIFKHYFRYYK